MRQKSGPEKQPAEDAIRDIRRATRRHVSAEEKIRVVLEGLRGEESIAELCRRKGNASSMMTHTSSAVTGSTVAVKITTPAGEAELPIPTRGPFQPLTKPQAS
jgi:hypothetical protein